MTRQDDNYIRSLRYARIYRQTHPEKIKKDNEKYRKTYKRPSKIAGLEYNEYYREYYHNNREKINERNKKRRNKKVVFGILGEEVVEELK